MSSFNTVTKIKYDGKTDEPATLNEYIVFQDDKSKLKYIIFRFSNNVTQQLLGMQFEVCQYDVDGDLIEKSVVMYDQFLAGAEEEFVPKAKLKVNYECSTISVRLIQAAYDRFVWKEGEFLDSAYKFGTFFKEQTEPKEGDGHEDKKNAKDKKGKRDKDKTQKSKYSLFQIKDVTSGNLALLPKVFNGIVIAALILFVVISMIIFKKDTKKFTDGNYLVRITASEDAAIYGYLGSESNLVIPEKLGGYKVTKIDGGAFKNSKIATVTVNFEITVETGAFVNCKNLRIFNATAKVTVMSEAFKGCNAALANNFIYPNGSFIAPNHIVN